jgi:hypothetical protein
MTTVATLNNLLANSEEFYDMIGQMSHFDYEQLIVSGRSYGDSWKKRGGVGAFMMLARKWDRIEKQTSEQNWDIFQAIHANPTDSGIIDDIRDLRRYLLLVEAEMTLNGPIRSA